MKIALFVLSLFVSLSLIADPILDNTVSSKRVGWFSNKGYMSCRETCKRNYSLIAEHELYDKKELTFLCKVMVDKIEPPISTPTHMPKPLTMWTYGNEIYLKKVCEFVLDHRKIDYSKEYYCLCSTK